MFCFLLAWNTASASGIYINYSHQTNKQTELSHVTFRDRFVVCLDLSLWVKKLSRFRQKYRNYRCKWPAVSFLNVEYAQSRSETYVSLSMQRLWSIKNKIDVRMLGPWFKLWPIFMLDLKTGETSDTDGEVRYWIHTASCFFWHLISFHN